MKYSTCSGIGTKFKTKQEAQKACPSYCVIKYCKDCKSWHVVQDAEGL